MASYEMMQSYLDMITAGDFVGAEKFYADDFRAHVKGHNLASGDYVGRAEYTRALGELMDVVDSMTVEQHDLLVSDDHAVVLSTWHVTRGGETADLNHVVVYHTVGEEISEMWIIPEDSETNAAFLS
jgi:ketosteroid isomerase-like protein